MIDIIRKSGANPLATSRSIKTNRNTILFVSRKGGEEYGSMAKGTSVFALHGGYRTDSGTVSAEF
jgi:hypothetical protein